MKTKPRPNRVFASMMLPRYPPDFVTHNDDDEGKSSHHSLPTSKKHMEIAIRKILITILRLNKNKENGDGDATAGVANVIICIDSFPTSLRQHSTLACKSHKKK